MAYKKEVIVCGLILVLLTLSGIFAGFYTATPTAQVVKENDERKTFAHNLNDRVTRFFDVYAVDFPRGTCTNIIEELYNNFAYQTTEITSGYKTTAKERIATINFGTEISESLGTIDLIKGKVMTGQDDADSFITMHLESVIRLAREDRRTFIAMNLYGNSKELLSITRGSFSTPSIDCDFTSENGIAECNCRTHALEGFVTD